MIAIVLALIVRDRVADAVCAVPPESVTLKVSELWAATAEGLPAISPLDAFSDNPDGRVPPVNDHL